MTTMTTTITYALSYATTVLVGVFSLHHVHS